MKQADYYDNVFNTDYAGDKGAFENVHNEMLKMYQGGKVLDIGCGTGNFLKKLKDIGVIGDGLDFSSVGLKKTQEKCPESKLFLLEANKADIYNNYEVFVMSEFLEHIDDDRGLISKLPKGSKVIVSVPTFDWVSHVRFFETEQSVTERYGDLIDIVNLQKVGGNFIFNGTIK
jgi:2-polyprenyl-3-methyl-5-hydroxy-6-metoxy-1,4-benzoquinol methylase